MKDRLCRHIMSDPSLNGLAYRLAGELKSDLLQELALIVCEKDDRELELIVGYFNFWCVRTLINMTGKRGNFTKTYNERIDDSICEHLKFLSTSEYEQWKDEAIDAVNDELDRMKKNSRTWYRSEMFRFYVECGSFRKVTDEVGIPHVSVYNTVKEVREHLKEKI